MHRDELLLQSLTLFLFLLHCSTVGFAVNNRLRLWHDQEWPRNNIYLQWFFALSSGLALNITCLFLLGITGAFYGFAVWVAGVALWGAALAALGGFPAFLARVKSVRIGFGLKEPLIFTTFFVLFFYLAFSAVRAPGSWDDTMYHLPLARFYIEHHAIILDRYVRFPLFPQNMELLFALGLMMGGEVAAQGMANLPLFVIGVGMVGAGVWLLRSVMPGILAIAILLDLGPVQYSLGYSYIDSGLALFCWGSLLAFALWAGKHTRSKEGIILAGALAGIAVGCKYHGCILIGAPWFYLIAIRRDWRGAAVFAIAAAAFGGEWYMRSAVISGNPFHPAAANIFGYFLWDAQDLRYQVIDLDNAGVRKNLLYLFQALSVAGADKWRLAFLSFFYFSFKEEKEPLRLFQGSFACYFLFWFFAAQGSRYLAPIFAVGSFLSGYFLYKAARSKFIFPYMRTHYTWLFTPPLLKIIGSAILFCIFSTSYKAAHDRLAHWQESLTQRDGYVLFEQANRLMPVFGTHMVQAGFENGIYFFEGTAIGDWFGPGRYRNMLHCTPACRLIPPSEMKGLMKNFDSRMLAVNTKRFSIDIAAYQKYFDIQKKTDDGYLLTEKKDY